MGGSASEGGWGRGVDEDPGGRVDADRALRRTGRCAVGEGVEVGVGTGDFSGDDAQRRVGAGGKPDLADLHAGVGAADGVAAALDGGEDDSVVAVGRGVGEGDVGIVSEACARWGERSGRDQTESGSVGGSEDLIGRRVARRVVVGCRQAEAVDRIRGAQVDGDAGSSAGVVEVLRRRRSVECVGGLPG